MNTTLALEFGTNLFGNLNSEIKQRLEAVIENPCQETWDDTYSIILNANKFVTLWQAVCEIDPSFNKSKGCNSEWSKIPSKQTIIKAIKKAVFEGQAKQELN